MAPRLSLEEQRRVFEMRGKGATLREIGAAIGCAHETVRRVAGERRGPLREWVPGPGRLTADDREEISRGLGAGATLSAIAAQLGRSVSTVSREVAANGGRRHYRATRAHRRARKQARRPKAAKLDAGPLVDQVTVWLLEWWSPQQISRRLRVEFARDPMMRVSYETIYQSLFVQGRGELRRELARCLRSGRTTRRAQHGAGASRLADMVSISDRPAEVEDRAVPGHWEGDLIMGSNNRSAIGTLVERSTRFVLLFALRDGHDAAHVDAAMRAAIATLGVSVPVRTITWDQGGEMARHVQFTIDTGIQVYFCDPHSPWQRGSNENTNGLVRTLVGLVRTLVGLGRMLVGQIALSPRVNC